MVSAEYLAGFIDGEGSLSLARRRRPRRSVEYSVRVAVYNTDRGILEEVRQTWGGTLASGWPRNPAWKPWHELIWTNAAAVELLTSLAPHLMVKSKHAAALLEFDAHLRKCRRGRDNRGRLLPLSERELEIREAFHTRLKRLNKRGSELVVSGPPNSTGCEFGPRNLSPEYVAGFIDAEGSLMIPKSKDRDHLRTQYRARVSLSNTDRAILECVRRTYGGILVNQASRAAGWKPSYQLVWSNGMIEPLLSWVVPFLRLKRKQASVMLQFIRHKKSTRRGRKGSGFAPFPHEVMAFREALYTQMRKLNAKGRPVRGGELRHVTGVKNAKSLRPLQGP